ncbi:MAG: hypothetical protein ABL883_10570 [Terricaulis sp.]
MRESPPLRVWPPPPETAEVKREQIKLTCTALNAIAITLFVTGLFGPILTTIADERLPVWVRLLLCSTAIILHLAAGGYLRYIAQRG